MKVVMLLAINEAYAESLEKLINNVQYAIMENKKRQEAVSALMGRTASASDFFGNTKKVPVSQFHPPYFRDQFGMIPPANTETQRKLMSGDYDPLVKPERKWLQKDLDRLRYAVKREVADCRCSSQKKRRTELQEMLKRSGQETSEEERSSWLEEIDSLTRYIEYTRNLSDEEIFGSEYDYKTVDWSKIATYDFLDTRSATQLRLKWNNEQSPKWSKAGWSSEELEKLQSLATGPWVRWEVVARLLGTGRTPFQCFLKYKLECDKEAKLIWSKEEDTALITLCHSLRINGKIPWEKVCCYMEGRSRQQCKVRYDRTLNVELKYGRWSEEEDILLKCAVGRFGKNWKQVASCVPGRTDAQCRDRWVNILDEKIKDSPWTLEEDEALLKGVREMGKEWARIALTLPGRTGDHCKTRFRSLMVSKVKLCNQDEVSMKSTRRHDTTKQRRERRKAVEKHFEELLAGDGQNEVARELANIFKTESLNMDATTDTPDVSHNQRNDVVGIMKEMEQDTNNGDSEVSLLETSRTRYKLLQEKLSMRPELFDNTTRTSLFKVYERAFLKQNTGRRPKEILSTHEKDGFSESLDSLPTEKDKRNFLMDHLVELMRRSDNADQCFLHQHVRKSQCIEDLKYHLNEELVNETERLLCAGIGHDILTFNPLPPFTASLKVYSSFTNMIPSLKGRALCAFSKSNKNDKELSIQLSSEIKEAKWYKILKMKLKSLLFWPALMDKAIESDPTFVRYENDISSSNVKNIYRKKEVRKISNELKSPNKSYAAELMVRDLIDARRRTKLKLPERFISKKLKCPGGCDNDGIHPVTECSTEVANECLHDENTVETDNDCTIHLRPEAERLLMIDECITSVRQKVATASLTDLLDEFHNCKKYCGSADDNIHQRVQLSSHIIQKGETEMAARRKRSLSVGNDNEQELATSSSNPFVAVSVSPSSSTTGSCVNAEVQTDSNVNLNISVERDKRLRRTKRKGCWKVKHMRRNLLKTARYVRQKRKALRKCKRNYT